MGCRQLPSRDARNWDFGIPPCSPGIGRKFLPGISDAAVITQGGRCPSAFPSQPGANPKSQIPAGSKALMKREMPEISDCSWTKDSFIHPWPPHPSPQPQRDRRTPRNSSALNKNPTSMTQNASAAPVPEEDPEAAPPAPPLHPGSLNPSSESPWIPPTGTGPGAATEQSRKPDGNSTGNNVN